MLWICQWLVVSINLLVAVGAGPVLSNNTFFWEIISSHNKKRFFPTTPLLLASNIHPNPLVLYFILFFHFFHYIYIRKKEKKTTSKASLLNLHDFTGLAIFGMTSLPKGPWLCLVWLKTQKDITVILFSEKKNWDSTITNTIQNSIKN